MNRLIGQLSPGRWPTASLLVQALGTGKVNVEAVMVKGEAGPHSL